MNRIIKIKCPSCGRRKLINLTTWHNPICPHCLTRMVSEELWKKEK